MTTKFDSKAYIQREYGSLVGTKIVGVRAMTASEMTMFGWEDGWGEVPFLLILDDGRALVPSMDPEGNGAGHLFVEQLA